MSIDRHQHAGISPRAINSGPETTIALDEAHAFFDTPARVEVNFRRARMESIVVTFSQPPTLRDVVSAYEKQFGAAVQKLITANQFDQSTVRWLVVGKSGELSVLLTEGQGIVKLAFSVRLRG